MIIIAHRGLLDGPNKLLENSPIQIKKCIDEGYDVEIDLRYEHGNLYLGHDLAQYEITFDFLLSYKNNLWIHCKDSESLFFMQQKNKGFDGFNYFFHDRDQFTLTSKGIIWCYPHEPYNEDSIVLMPEWYIKPEDFDKLNGIKCLGICTDFPTLINKIL